MEVKRKPKGSEGGSLQIRDLDNDTLMKLQELQKYFGVGTSSKAVLCAVRQFINCKKEAQVLRLQLMEANRTIAGLSQMLEQVACIADNFKRNKMEFD